jgi:hypothetical protein
MNLRVRKSPPEGPTLNLLNPVNILARYFCKIHSIIFPSMSRFAKKSLQCRFSEWNVLISQLFMPAACLIHHTFTAPVLQIPPTDFRETVRKAEAFLCWYIQISYRQQNQQNNRGLFQLKNVTLKFCMVTHLRRIQLVRITFSKGKAIPVTGREGPLGCEPPTLPHFV